MTFSQLNHKYNYTFNALRGSAIQFSVIQEHQIKVIGGYRTDNSILCFQHELKRVSVTNQASIHFGIEDLEVFGDEICFCQTHQKKPEQQS